MSKPVKKATQIKPQSTEKLDDMINDICGLSDEQILGNDFLQEMLGEEQELFETAFEEEVEEVKEDDMALKTEGAKKFITSFIDKISSMEFQEECERIGHEYNLPKKVVAKNFFMRCLGLIGDALGIAIETSRGVLTTLLNLLYWVLKQGIDLICNVANALGRIATLNQTAK